MTAKETRKLIGEYKRLKGLAQVKLCLLEEYKRNCDGIRATDYALPAVKSSPTEESLNPVERRAERLLKYDNDYMTACELAWEAEDKILSLAGTLPPEEEAMVIERYMQGKDLAYISRKYHYSKEYVKVKFCRILNKWQSDNF